ncbi:hypothetical protein A8C14_003379 [Klebsiella aerogenes]|nr:hypothetical protein [Klebsiella aerogenes]EIW9213714.1 hypothetical protein [Klebsiella aerogenes]
MTNNHLTGYRADGGEISIGRIKEIADNPYGDEEKQNLAKRLLAAEVELQERRKTAAEPAAYLVCNGRLYQDRPFLSLSAARISVNDRNDGAEIKALCVSGALAEKAK